MGCSVQKIGKQPSIQKRWSQNTNLETPVIKQSCDVFDPNLRKFVQVPILIPASKSKIVKKRSIQLTIGQ